MILMTRPNKVKYMLDFIWTGDFNCLGFIQQ